MPKIMLVEDDLMIAEIYIKKFELAGFEVVNATTGREVLRLAGEQKFDIILLDMVLPEMSGMDVLKELRSNPEYSSDLKVIVLSNLNKTDYERDAMKNGANGFIGKTEHTPSELVAEIQRILNEYSEQKKNKERLGGEVSNSGNLGKKILFIEDEELFLEMFGKKLENEGYSVDYAKNGAWGTKLALQNEYDLVVTDISMPAMGGREFIENIKLNEKTANIPVIVISASILEEDIQPVRDLGVTEFYEKTKIVPSDLTRKVNEILN